MLKAIKIRLYPTHDQATYINKLLGTSRFVYKPIKQEIYKLWRNW